MLDVGRTDEHELGFVNDDTIGLQAPHFGSKDLDIGPDVLLKVELEGQKCNEDFENIGGAGPICTLDDGIQQVFNLVIVDTLVIQPLAVLRMVSAILMPTLLVMASAVSSFAPIMA